LLKIRFEYEKDVVCYYFEQEKIKEEVEKKEKVLEEIRVQLFEQMHTLCQIHF